MPIDSLKPSSPRAPLSPTAPAAKSETTAPARVLPGAGNAFDPGRATVPPSSGADDPMAEMVRAGYFRLPPNADPMLSQAALTTWGAVVSSLGQLSPAPSAPRPLAPSDVGGLERLRKGIEALNQLPSDARSGALREALRGWLGQGLPVSQVATRLEIALETGYALVDKGPLLANPYDRTGWSDTDLAQIRGQLSHLPDKLKNIPNLYYLTRDARSVEEDALLAKEKAALDASTPKNLGQRLLKDGLGALLGAVESMKMGVSFGTAWFESKEVRLYGELFAGSRLPGLHQMLAYTTLHEIGHHQLRNDPALFGRFLGFYESVGKAEAPNAYAASNIDEGYGVGLGMYAVAPELLKRKSPKTFEFFQKEFGDSLASYQGHGLESRAIDLVYGLTH